MTNKISKTANPSDLQIKKIQKLLDFDHDLFENLSNKFDEYFSILILDPIMDDRDERIELINLRNLLFQLRKEVSNE